MNFNWESKNIIEIKFINRVNGKNKSIRKKVKIWKTRKERRRRNKRQKVR